MGRSGNIAGIAICMATVVNTWIQEEQFEQKAKIETAKVLTGMAGAKIGATAGAILGAPAMGIGAAPGALIGGIVGAVVVGLGGSAIVEFVCK